MATCSRIFKKCYNSSAHNGELWNEDEFDSTNNIHIFPHNTTNNVSIDISKFNFPKHIWYIIPKWELGVKVGTFIPIILLGIIGNVILLHIIMKNRALRTPTNLLIANLAAADAATLSICPIMLMFHDFFQNYMLGAIGCKIEGFLDGAFLITAVLNLCAVSYDRLTAIVLPLETRLTVKGAKLVMCGTWIAGILLSIPLAVYRTYKERQWKNFLETYCSEDTTFLQKYWHVLIAALVWLPLSVMVICYSAIFHKLDRYEKKVLKREHPMCVSYKTKVAKTLFIIVVTFVVLRLPFTALVFIRNEMLNNTYVNQILGSFQILWYTSHYLIFFNAAVNPFIYGLSNDNFRRAYHQTPLLRCFCKPKPDLRKSKNRSFGRLFYGALQPRGPCLEDKFGGAKTFNGRDMIGKVGFISKLTKTTNIRQFTSKFDDTEVNKQKFQYTDNEGRISTDSLGYI